MDELNFNIAQNVVLETLQQAVSQNPELLESSEKKLKEYEASPGFNTVLQSIFLNYDIDHNIRLLAVLCVKNGIDRYWRKSAPNALSEEEKATLRRGFLSDFLEPQLHVAKQRAVLIAKVARFDCPHDWPELIPTLLQAIRDDNPIVQNRSILVLRQVVKNLSSKRLAGDKKMFHELSENIFHIIYSVLDSHSTIFFQKFNLNYSEAKNSLDNALLALRILEKLTVYGFKVPYQNDKVKLFLTTLYGRIDGSSQIRREVLRGREVTSLNQLERDFVVTLEKLICKQVTILLNLLENHPYSFIELIKPSLKLAMQYAFTDEGHVYLFERFLIQCFNMIKAIVLCAEFKFALQSLPKLNDDRLVLIATDVKDKFFKPAVVNDICYKLITHYFLLTPADLELWESDPESFATDDAGESWKYSLRPCVETLFVTIFHEYRVILAPMLVELIKSNASIVPPEHFDALLLKDAVYNAIGLAAFDLYDEVNFNEWLLTSLRNEVAISGNCYRIIRRRIAWLLGRWTGVKLSSQLYPVLYTVMIPLLSPQEDLVVRLQAAQTIKTVVGDFEFNTELFLEYLPPLFEALFQLLKDVQECDTKMRVLSVLYFVVERVGSSIEPYCENLLKYLPLLWNESENHNMLRCEVVGTLVHLVKALGHIKVPMDIHDFILSIISFSTDMSHDSGFYLLEDGLELWLVVVENIDQPSPVIMQLFSKMPVLLANNTEYLRPCIVIMKAYVLLAPDEFLKTHGQAMINSCIDLLNDLEPDGIVSILKLFELCIKANEPIGIPLIKPILQTIFWYLYQGDANQYSIGTRLMSITTLHFSILSRILLSSSETFIEVVDKIAADAVVISRERIISTILDNWFVHMPLVGLLDRKKLMALGLCSLLTSNGSFVYEKFCGILLAVVETLNDVTRNLLNGEIIDSYLGNFEEELSDFDCFETVHDLRKKKLAAADPIHSVNLTKYFSYQLSELGLMMGPEKFKQFVDTVDAETLDMVCSYFNIREMGKEVSGAGATNDELIKLFRTQLEISYQQDK